MENTPLTGSERGPSKKKKSKIARDMARVVGADTEKSVPKAPEAPKAMSLSERLAHERELRTEKRKVAEAMPGNDAEDAKKPEKTEQPASAEITPAAGLKPAPETTPDEAKKEVEPDEAEEVEPASVAGVLEAANWEPEEGEIAETGEIPLTPRPPDAAPMFAELPVGEPEDEPDDAAEVEPELLAEGLEAEPDDAEDEDEADPAAANVPPVQTPNAPPSPNQQTVHSFQQQNNQPPANPNINTNTPAPIPAPQQVFYNTAPTPGSPWYNAAAANKTALQHQEELDETAYRSEKRGLSRGVLAGGIAGFLFGRHGKKKAAREHEKVMNEKDKQVESAEKQAAAARIEALKRTEEAADAAFKTHELEAKHYNQEADRKRAEARAEKAKRSSEEPRAAEKATHGSEELPRAESQPSNQKDTEKAGTVPSSAAELATAVPASAAAEVLRHTPETEAASRPFEAANIAAAPAEKTHSSLDEKLPEDTEITEDTYAAPEGSRVEASSWHRIEIDKKTGKPVDNPEVAYGEEFRREQARERLREDPKTTSGGSAGPAAFLGGLAAASIAGEPDDGLASGPYDGREADGGLAAVQTHHEHLTKGNELLHYASKPLIWAIAGVIVLGLFVLGILR